MSRAVLASIRPRWCVKIAALFKPVEVRKTAPKLETPFKVYIYCTKEKPRLRDYVKLPKAEQIALESWCGKVIGEFTCYKVEDFTTDYRMNRAQTEFMVKASCLTMTELMEYEGNSPCLYGWHISDLVMYEKPKELSELYKADTLSAADFEYMLYDGRRTYAEYLFTKAIRKPPQSWCYVEDLTA